MATAPIHIYYTIASNLNFESIIIWLAAIGVQNEIKIIIFEIYNLKLKS